MLRTHARNLGGTAPTLRYWKRRLGVAHVLLMLAIAFSGMASPPAQAQSSMSELSGRSLPPLPPGRPTVIGGTVEKLDPVRDQFVLRIFGGQSMKMRYDPRTAIFRDGVRQSLLSLKNGQPASVETVLDGTSVFAISIHTLTQVQSGNCQGQIVSTDLARGQMTVRCGLSPNPLVFAVTGSTAVSRVSAMQGVAPTPASTGDAVPGTLVSILFRPAADGHPVASSIAVLASPGSPFVFAGTLTFLDLHDGRMTVETSPGASYSLSFTPRNFPQADALKTGDRVRVTAVFDGTGYTAQDVKSY